MDGLMMALFIQYEHPPSTPKAKKLLVENDLHILKRILYNTSQYGFHNASSLKIGRKILLQLFLANFLCFEPIFFLGDNWPIQSI